VFKEMGTGQFSGTIIEDELIYNMLKMIFELAWKGAGKEVGT
jgi:hypothetical protein